MRRGAAAAARSKQEQGVNYGTFFLSLREAQPHLFQADKARQAHRARDQGRHARGAHRPVGGGRQHLRRQKVHRRRIRQGGGAGDLAEPQPRPAGHQDRQRRADRPHGLFQRQIRGRRPPADGHHDVRPAGRGQDHPVRQAGDAAQKAGQKAAVGGGRHLPPRRHPPIAGGGGQGGRARV